MLAPSRFSSSVMFDELPTGLPASGPVPPFKKTIFAEATAFEKADVTRKPQPGNAVTSACGCERS